MAAKFLDADVERHACAQRRLFEDHGQRFALQRMGVGAGVGLHLTGNMQQMSDLLRREVADRDEILWRHATSRPQQTLAGAFARTPESCGLSRVRRLPQSRSALARLACPV